MNNDQAQRHDDMEARIDAAVEAERAELNHETIETYEYQPSPEEQKRYDDYVREQKMLDALEDARNGEIVLTAEDHKAELIRQAWARDAEQDKREAMREAGMF